MTKHPKELFEERLSTSDKIAMRVANFTGNMAFVWLHIIIFLGWIVLNVVAYEQAWDPYPFNFLTLVVSLEAIFLSTFVLISQNRESRRNEIREQLDYEVNIKAEKEIQELKKMVQELLKSKKTSK